MKSSKEIKEAQIWNPEKQDLLSEYILHESKKQSPEQQLKNEILSIQYQIEDYLAADEIEQQIRILDFVKLYLNLLNISQKQLATVFGMKDSNLYKYLIGERKLNPDIVLKLSSFSHTQPELWYYIQIKNELFEIRQEKKKLKEYQKYTYENFQQHSSK